MVELAWKPTASFNTLRQRSHILKKIRHFFETRAVLEVETPLLGPSTIPDPTIASFSTLFYQKTPLYLQTSPEFFMKRLLAAGSGPIFQICKAFRDEEQGRLHSPEFTLLEWYQPGYDHHRLMKEVAELIQWILPISPVNYLSYQALFEFYLGIQPHTVSVETLIKYAESQGIHAIGLSLNDKDAWLQILLNHLIEPQLKGLSFIYDYPSSQAALAKHRQDHADYLVAERFEVYLDSVELANGFHELNNPQEQRERFQSELKKRQLSGLPLIPIDERLLLALATMPESSGVALGIDRLIRHACQSDTIGEIMSFVTETKLF